MRPVSLALATPLCAWLSLHAPLAWGEEAPSTAPLTLDRAVTLAMERNEAVLSAQQRVVAADARVSRARAFFFPELAATGTYIHRQRETVRDVGGQQVILQRQNALNGSAVARVVLFDARGFPLYQAAKLEGEAARFDAVQSRRQVGFEAAGAFLATLGNQQVFEAAEQRLTYARQAHEDARARAQAGLTSTNDVTRAELEMSSAEVQLAASAGRAQESRLELGYLLVADAEEPLAPPEALLAEANGPLGSFAPLAQGAQERRPDLLAAELRVRAAEANAREPLARLLPAITGTAQYRLTNDAGLNGRTGDGFLSVDLAWTLFDGGERYAERRERVALTRALALDTQALSRRVDVDIQRARVALESAQAAVRQSELAAKTARVNAEESSILYRQGLTSALSVTDASVRRFEAEVALAQSRYALGVALLGLRSAVGLDPLGKEP
ncbi:TolC family protein [Myxococcaceae bacterium GXIMD 01537]